MVRRVTRGIEASISLTHVISRKPSTRGDTVGRSNEFDVSMQSLQRAQSEAEKRVKVLLLLLRFFSEPVMTKSLEW